MHPDIQPESSGSLTVDRRYELARQWFAQGDFAAAAELLEQTIPQAPHWSPLFFALGEACAAAGMPDSAMEAFRRYLELDPGDRLGAIIELSLLGAVDQPGILPGRYVEELFDRYAPRFETALLERLSYSAPRLLQQAVESVRPFEPSGPGERILDLGCGTGLAAEALFKRASWLEGVDLSAGMLAQAQAKRIYHRLTRADIAEFLGARNAEQSVFDLIVAADVFVYVGALDALFALAAARLSRSGLFAFSVQALGEGDYLLGEDHRYAHSRGYIERCLAQAKLRLEYCGSQTIRTDRGQDVGGLIVVASPSPVDLNERHFPPLAGPGRKKIRPDMPT